MTTRPNSQGLLGLIDFGKKPDGVTILMMLGGAILAGVGLAYVLLQLVLNGHSAFNTSSNVAWGAPIAFYLFFLLTSSGLSVIASLDTVFGLKVFYPVAKRCMWLSITTLVAGFSILALEIGHPFRMIWAIPMGMQFHSPMWWMGVFYSIDLVLLCVKFYLMHTGEWHTKRAHYVSIASFTICILAPGTLGLVFGMMAMRPAWYSPVMPMYFILTGFATATAFILFITSLYEHEDKQAEVKRLYTSVLPRLFFVSLLAVIAMRFGQIITGLWSNYEGMEAHWHALRSPLFHVEIWLGFVLPALLMASESRRQYRPFQALAALLFGVGIFFARLELLIVGQVVPLFKGSFGGYAEYWPSATEWMLVPAGFGIFYVLYGAGNWLLRLSETSEQ
ncbi:Molybdopterin Oxidoreductase Membrane Subunit [Paramagnetospirillum magnetotacticum MS-1]|uniref:Molybdopterin Oxidoreductase Membrane Subunit n=1 Tax=Paramagnetospirillum magnetotacticum MS-1 TaxID=272627 RepID=A0A0C2YZA6_PARME|nr:NrfD/PsrC family molybdoenzyme membrane anchor subunit [Paramagnetospirillum magnetotacticum]KIM00419.1 Molybdopterin Oxidoreductase Membrane Subunit [Paramagnetospirillum magnetotacticum MS-1]